MDMNYEFSHNEQLPNNKVERENNKEIATILLQYLSSPKYSTEEKVDLLLELLNRANKEKDDIKNYSLAILKNSLKNLGIEQSENKDDNKHSSHDMYGIFGENNTFIIARESSYCISGISDKFNYTLLDSISNSKISEYTYYKKYSQSSNIPWRNGITLINGIQSYVVPITTIIPAKYIERDKINYNVLQIINDTVNEYLASNPLFVKEVFIKQRKKQAN